MYIILIFFFCDISMSNLWTFKQKFEFNTLLSFTLLAKKKQRQNVKTLEVWEKKLSQAAILHPNLMLGMVKKTRGGWPRTHLVLLSSLHWCSCWKKEISEPDDVQHHFHLSSWTRLNIELHSILPINKWIFRWGFK